MPAASRAAAVRRALDEVTGKRNKNPMKAKALKEYVNTDGAKARTFNADTVEARRRAVGGQSGGRAFPRVTGGAYPKQGPRPGGASRKKS